MKVPINVPDSLNELTVRQYQEYLDIENPTNKDVLRVFLRLSDLVIGKMSKIDVDKVATSIVNMFNQEQPLVQIFNYAGLRFGFIPDLEHISQGEFDDATEYFDKPEDLHRLMAVLYRPVTNKKGGKYLIEKYEGSSKYAEIMLNAPLNVALSAKVFFWNLLNDLLNATPNYILKQLTPEQMEMTVSVPSGVNTIGITLSVREILEGLTKYQNSQPVSA